MFDQEQRLEDQAAARPRAESVSLAELQSSGIPLEWFEVVAIIQGLCRLIFNAENHTGPAKLGLADVRIDSAGRVRVSMSQSGDRDLAVRSIADLMRATLPDHDVPSALRLVLTQASLCASLEEFYALFERFERPNGNVLAREVYERWAGAPARPATAPPASEPEIVSPATPDKRSPRRWRQIAVTCSAVAIPVLAGGVVAVSRFHLETPSVFSSRPQLIGTAAAAAITAANSAAERLLDRVLPSRQSASPEPSVPAADAASPAKPSRPVRRRPTAQQIPEPSASAPVSSALDATPVSPSETAESTSAAQVAALGPPASTDAFIYSITDGEVVAPVPIYPRFPTTRPTDTAVIEFEVVVAENGNVEAVKARRNPQTLGEAMIVTTSLSASKTWRFSPAMKQGRAVKYRRVVWVTASF